MSELEIKIGDRIRSYDFGTKMRDTYCQGIVVELNSTTPSGCCSAHYKTIFDYRLIDGKKVDLKGDEYFWAPMYKDIFGKSYVEKPLVDIVA